MLGGVEPVVAAWGDVESSVMVGYSKCAEIRVQEESPISGTPCVPHASGNHGCGYAIELWPPWAVATAAAHQQ